jgi:hypothetical protein
VSFRHRLERFLFSRRNIAGSVLGLGGVALLVAGITGGVVGLGAIAAFYAIGFLAVRPERGLNLRLDQTQDIEELRDQLDHMIISIRFRVKDDIYNRVQEIRNSILFLVSHSDPVEMVDPEVYTIRQIALRYLPEALSAYLEVPRIYAELRPVANGRTPHDVLLDQLNLMDAKLREVGDDMMRHDSEQLLANGRFLAERFARSSINVPIEAQGVPAEEEQKVRVI